MRDVLHIFIRTVFSSLRRRVKKQSGIRKAKCGGVTFVQRFGGAIYLNMHIHSLIPDGICYEDDDCVVRFHRLRPPTDLEVENITEGIARRVKRLLKRLGLGPDSDPEEADTLSREQPLLAELYTASGQGRISTGPGAGNYLETAGYRSETAHSKGVTGSRCSNISGFRLRLRLRRTSQSSCECRHSGEGSASASKICAVM
jgi:hypothetical protein